MTTEFNREKAISWDSPLKVEISSKFVSEMKKNINFGKSLKVMDFGCGTGLVGLNIASLVKSVVFIDTSKAMLEVLQHKAENKQKPSASYKIIHGSIDRYTSKDIDVLFTLMALHHIEDTQATIERFASIIKPGGVLVIGDLNEEDGLFHGTESVPHNGFYIPQLAQELENSDFDVVKTYTFNTIKRDHKEYEQFILFAKKRLK